MGEDAVPGWDEDLPVSCTCCGWAGPGGGLRGAGPGDGPAGPFDVGCPRCGSPLMPEAPSVDQIVAVRRDPGA